MLTQPIIDYVNLKKSQGQTRDQIRQELIISGWTPQQADAIDPLFSTSPAPPQSPDRPVVTTKAKLGRKPLFLLLSLLLVIGSLAVPGYLIAYGKLILPHAQLNKLIKTSVLSLPFLPKTPEAVFTLSQNRMSQNTSASFDFSVAVSSLPSDLVSALGLDRFDLSATGFFDIANAKNPLIEMTLKLNNDTEVNFVSANKVLYFQVVKYPMFLSSVLSLLGIAPKDFQDAFVSQWLSVDLNDLETPARSYLNLFPTPTPTAEKVEIEKRLQNILTQRVFPHVKLSRETLDSQPVYKLSFAPDSDTLDTLFQELEGTAALLPLPLVGRTPTTTPENHRVSDYIKNFQVQMFVHRESYHVIQTVFSQDMVAPPLFITSPSQPEKTSTVRIVAILKLSNFNASRQIPIPPSAQPAQQVIEKLLNQVTLKIPEAL